MHDVVFKLAVAVILASAIMFLLADSFGQLHSSTDLGVSNVEDARKNSLDESVEYLQKT
jgi:hypothetical protein